MGIFACLFGGLLAYLLMQIRPGVNINILDVVPARSAPTDTGTWFVLGTTDRGPITPVLVQSLQEFVNIFGDRQAYSLLYDSLDAFFHEGGRRAIIQRVVGPAPTTGTANIYDQAGSTAGDVSILASALGPGAYSSNITVSVLAGVASGFRVQVVYTSGTTVVTETSNDLATAADAVAWSQNSNLVRFTLGVSNEVPRVQGPTALAAGTDDRVNITNTQKQAAVAKYTQDLGPGQISYPGETSATVHGYILTHCAQFYRTALLDLQDTATSATLITAVQADRTNGRWGAAFTPWAIIPGLTPSVPRTVPYSAIQAGIIARNDVTLDANVAAAGEDGQSTFAIGLSQIPWDDTTRQQLNDNGANVARIMYGGVRTYGYRSLAHPQSDPNWISFGGSRLMMEIAWRAGQILDVFMFDEINSRLLGQVTGQLKSMLDGFYILGSLYGATPGEAYSVVCDSSNNTPATITDRQLNASIAARVSEMAEMISLNLTRVPVNRSL